MLKYSKGAVQEQYCGKRRPKNTVKKWAVPTALLSKELSIKQTKVKRVLKTLK
jgi:hypothetical protein